MGLRDEAMLASVPSVFFLFFLRFRFLCLKGLLVEAMLGTHAALLLTSVAKKRCSCVFFLVLLFCVHVWGLGFGCFGARVSSRGTP